MNNLRKLIRRYRTRSSDKQQRRGQLARRAEPTQRRLTTESLERRELLAGDMLAFHNPWNQFDVNNDYTISARDALGVINYLGRGGEAEQGAGVGEQMFYDVNGDNQITAADALGVINAIGRGEAAGEPLIELLLTAREYGVEPGTSFPFNNDLIAADVNNEINVAVGEVFELEVSYEDLRTFSSRLGAFQLITDVLTSQGNALTPVLFETQTLIIDQAIESVAFADRPNTSITLSIPNLPPGKSGDLTFTSSWTAFSQSPQIEVRKALEAFGYTSDEFFLATPEGVGDDTGIQIRWTDLEYADVDLPNISIEVNEAPGAANIPTSQAAVPPTILVGGQPQFNPAAIPFNLNVFSRTFNNNEPFYNSNVDGNFDPATGFTGLKGIGGVPSQGGGIPQLAPTNGYPPGPFDAYSLTVKFTQPVTDFVVSVQPNADQGAATESILIYGEDDRVPISNDTVIIEGVADADVLGNGRAALVINATGSNSDPTVSQSISATFSEDDGTTSVDLLQFSNDSDGNTLTVTNFAKSGDPSNAVSLVGTTASVATGAYGALNTGQSQVINLSYTLDDGNGGTVNQTATITINGVTDVTNSAPTVSAPISATFSEDDGTTSVDLLQFSNDSDGNTLTVTNFAKSGDPSNAVSLVGTTASVATGAYGALNTGQSQVINLSYTLDDGNGGTVNQTATITINGVTDVTNSAPTVSAPISATFSEDDGTTSVDLLQFSNDSDGNTLTVTNFAKSGDPSNAVSLVGTTASVATGAYGALNTGQSQVINLSYTLDDGNGGTVNQTATITINGVTDVTNSAPTVSAPISATFSEDDGTTSVDLLQFSNDSDGNTLTVTNFAKSGDPSNAVSLVGTTASVATGAYGALNTGQSQVINLSYTLDDGNGGTVNQTATITINGVTDVTNSAPTVSAPISATFSEDDGTTSVDLLQFSNDSDGNTLTVTNFAKSGDPSNAVSLVGTTASVATGAYGALNTGQSQVINLSYTLDDGNGGTVNQTATITINGVTDFVNSAPTVSGPVTASFNEGAGNGTVDLLAGASDVDNQTLSVSGLTLVSGNAVGISLGTNSLTVDPADYGYLLPSQSEIISYSYNVIDGFGGSVAQTATVTINGVIDDAPAAGNVPDATAFTDGGPITIDVLSSASAGAGENQNLSIVNASLANPAAGTVSSNGTIVFTPAPGFEGQTTINYQISDGTTPVGSSVGVSVLNFDPSSIGGYVFIDRIENMRDVLAGADPFRDGMKDANESGLGGVAIQLIGNGMTYMEYTDIHGGYEFTNVAPGSYQVVYDAPANVIYDGPTSMSINVWRCRRHDGRQHEYCVDRVGPIRHHCHRYSGSTPTGCESGRPGGHPGGKQWWPRRSDRLAGSQRKVQFLHRGRGF